MFCNPPIRCAEAERRNLVTMVLAREYRKANQGTKRADSSKEQEIYESSGPLYRRQMILDLPSLMLTSIALM
jgi:hypothetical protein